MYNNGYYGPQVKKVRATPAVWAVRAVLALTYAGCTASTVVQIYDGAPFGVFGMFSGGGLVAFCVIAGIVITAVRCLIYELLLRLGTNSLTRTLGYMGETAPDPNFNATLIGTCYIYANALTALFSVLSIFYASQLTVLSAFLAIIFKVLAMAAALLLLLRKVGKGNFSFAFSAFAPLFAVTIILL